MIQVAAGTKVYLACRPVSMRYGFDGLAAQVAQVLAADPFSGQVFLFRNKKGDYLKILHWDGPASRWVIETLCEPLPCRCPCTISCGLPWPLGACPGASRGYPNPVVST